MNEGFMLNVQCGYTVQQSLTYKNIAVRMFSIRYYGNLYWYKPEKFAGEYRRISLVSSLATQLGTDA